MATADGSRYLPDREEKQMMVIEVDEIWPCLQNSKGKQYSETWLEEISKAKKRDLFKEECFFVNQNDLKMIDDLKLQLKGNTLEGFKLINLVDPFETIDNADGTFFNRSGLKLVNMDNIFRLTKMLDGEDSFFADICGGPGGFATYLLKEMPKCKGIGITLSNRDNDYVPDYRLDETLWERFDANKGDILKKTIIQEFCKKVKEVYVAKDGEKGVHMVTADGGYEIEKNEAGEKLKWEYVEIKKEKLALCQAICALDILRNKGSFVLKIFSSYSDFAVGLIYLLSICFEKCRLFKPVTSRPMSAERFLVLEQYKKEQGDKVRTHLWKAYDEWPEEKDMKKSGKGLDLVKSATIKADNDFCQNLKLWNDQFIHRRIEYYKRANDLAEKTVTITAENLANKEKYRSMCLGKWGIQDKPLGNADWTLDDKDKAEKEIGDYLKMVNDLHPKDVNAKRTLQRYLEKYRRLKGLKGGNKLYKMVYVTKTEKKAARST